MNNNFFKSLDFATKILERAFELLKEKKIEKFDQESIDNIIESNPETYQIMKNRPRILKVGTKTVRQQLLSELSNNNLEQNEKLKNLDFNFTSEEKKIFQAMKITNLLPIQEICFKFFTNESINGHYFVQFDTGQGKTSLCLSIALIMTRRFTKVFIINSSKDLSFRDYKKAVQISALLNVNIIYANVNTLNLENFEGIIYLTLEQFINHKINKFHNEIQNSPLIIDEYDTFVFQDNKNLMEIWGILSQFQFIIAFSGSKLEDYHKVFIKKNLKASFINFSLPNSLKSSPQCKQIKVFSQISDYKKQILEICLDFLDQSPTIIITNEISKQIFKKLQMEKIPVENLTFLDPQQIDSLMQTFTEKVNQKFQVFIISQEQGRGLDFLSNIEIEENGGVNLVIGCLPHFFLQYQQFIGRTGRIGGKGQYHVILYDKISKNQDGQLYLNKKLLELQNKDMLNIPFIQTTDNNQEFNQEINYKSLQNTEIMEYDQQSDFIKNTPIFQQEEEKLLINENHNEKNNFKFAQKIYENKISNEQEIENKDFNFISKSLVEKRVTKYSQKQELRQSKRIQNIQTGKQYIDQKYYEGYSDPKIHEEMLQDKIRVDAFENAIKQVAQDQTIIDVGTGTGVLSMFAAKYGAKKVFAIDNSDIIKEAEIAIKKNQLQDIITLIKDDAEEIILPELKVDLIISEWMGYFCLYENMLPSVLSVRDQYLKENGRILPQNASIYISAFQKENCLNGLNFSQLGKNTYSLARIEICKQENIVSNTYQIFDFDLKFGNLSKSQFESDFELIIQKESQVDGFVSWFEVELIENMLLSTSPFNPPTHWKQTIFLLQNPIKMNQDEKLVGHIKVTQNVENFRNLDIQILYKGQKEKTYKKAFYTFE